MTVGSGAISAGTPARVTVVVGARGRSTGSASSASFGRARPSAAPETVVEGLRLAVNIVGAGDWLSAALRVDGHFDAAVVERRRC